MGEKARWTVDGRPVAFRCVICKEVWVPLYRAKTGRPHGFCPECHTQYFFRGERAVEILKELVRALPDEAAATLVQFDDEGGGG